MPGSSAYQDYEAREDLLGKIEAQAFLAMDSMELSAGRIPFPPVSVHDIPVDGIGCHYGVDRTLYYDLYSGDRKLISMNDWRLEEFLSENPDSDLRKMHDGIVSSLGKDRREEAKEGRERGKSRRRSETPRKALVPGHKKGIRR